MADYPIDLSVMPVVRAFFEEDSDTIGYVVRGPSSNSCAMIDSATDIDHAAGRITYDHA